MNRKLHICLVGQLTASMLAISADSFTVQAADCPAIHQAVQNERSLIKQKTLLRQAVEVDCPEDLALNLSYAFVLERLRKYEQALRYYQKASVLSSGQSAKAYVGMGDVLLILNRLEEAIADYEKGLKLDPTDERAQQYLAQARIKHKAQAGEQISATEFSEVMQAAPAVTEDSGTAAGPVLNLQIQFPSGSAALSAEAQAQIDRIAQALLSPALASSRFEIAGHTDSTGEPQANLFFSKARAEAVRDYLIHAHQIEPGRISVAYFGDTRPLMPNTSSENLSQNRRVEFKRLD